MQVQCEKCAAKYNIGDDKIKAGGTAVRCPKCKAVFKVFPESNDAPAGGDEDLFAGADLFGGAAGSEAAPDAGSGSGDGGDIFSDSPEPPAPAAPQDDASSGALFDDDPAPDGGDSADPFGAAPESSGESEGGLFDDAPAPAASDGGLFDDEPAADQEGGLFDDEPEPAAGGGLFDDEPAPSSAGGGLFDDEPAPSSEGGGLFDDEAAAPDEGGLFDDEPAPSSGESADPFAEFESEPGGQSDDPFAEFGAEPEDDIGFSEDALDGPDTSGLDDEDDDMPAPVREKSKISFQKKEISKKDQALEYLADNAVKLAMIGAAAVFLFVLAFGAALAFLPGFFNAQPALSGTSVGVLSGWSFSLQKVLGSEYYGQAMEAAYIDAGKKKMEQWSERGFEQAEKEFKQLQAFSPDNQPAKAALAELYATWDLVSESKAHTGVLPGLLGAQGVSPEVKVRALLVLGQPKEAAEAAGQLGDLAPMYAAGASMAAGNVTDAAEVFTEFSKKHPKNFLAALLGARSLRDLGRYEDAVSQYTVAGEIVGGQAKAQLEIGKIYFGPLKLHEKAMGAFYHVLTDKLGGSDKIKAESQYYLAQILHRRGRGPEAVSAINSALSVEPNNPRYLTVLGDIQFDGGKIVDAYRAYEKAKEVDGKFVDAYIGLGRANERLEKDNEALASYRTAIEIEPVNMRANVHYANLILKNGDAKQAEQVLSTVLERDPGNINALEHLAEFYVGQGRLADGLAQYGKIIDLAPESIEGYIGRGAVLLRQGKLGQAKNMFEKAMAIEPNNSTVLYRVGQVSYLHGDYTDAAVALKTALGRDPYHAEAHLYMGMTLVKQGKLTEALTELQKAVDINPRLAEAYRQRGLVYMMQSRTEEGGTASSLTDKAVKQLEQAIYHEPESADLYYDYGLVLNNANLAGKAKEAWMKAKELRPGFQDAMFRLAEYYVAFTDYKNAEAVLNEVLKSSPRNAKAYLGTGKVAFARGEYDAAQRAFARAAQLEPGLAEAHNALGEVYTSKGLFDEATYYYQKSLRVDPNFGPALLNMGLYYKDRDPERAKLSFKAAMKSGALSKEKLEEAQMLLRELEYVK